MPRKWTKKEEECLIDQYFKLTSKGELDEKNPKFWVSLALMTETRNSSSVKQRIQYILDKRVHRARRYYRAHVQWTEEEDDILMALHDAYVEIWKKDATYLPVKKWAIIAKELGKTYLNGDLIREESIRNHFGTLVKRHKTRINQVKKELDIKEEK